MNVTKKRLTQIIIVSLFVPLLFFNSPKKAEAQWPVFDIPTEVGTTLSTVFDGLGNAKEFLGDSVANFVAKLILKNLTAQTVNWINSGFKGNPAFMTDPQKFFLNVGDTVAADFLSNTNLNKLCSPFRVQVRLALVKNYLQETNKNNFSCTLGKIESNFNNFVKDFDQGGWDGWFVMTQTAQNNPYGAYLETNHQLQTQIGSKTTDYSDQLNRGMGFLNYEKCKAGSPIVGTIDKNPIPENRCNKYEDASLIPVIPGTSLPSRAPACIDSTTIYKDSNGNQITAEQIDSGIGEGDCTEKETVTPGNVINNQLTKALGTPWAELEAADEINEIVSALMTQMVSKLVQGVGNGLRGLSQGGSGSNGSSTFMEQMVGSTKAEQTQFNIDVNKAIPSDMGCSDPSDPTTCATGAPLPTIEPPVDSRHADFCLLFPSSTSCVDNSSGNPSTTNPTTNTPIYPIDSAGRSGNCTGQRCI